MGIKSLSNSSGIVNFQKHQSMLAGIELNKFHHLQTVRLASSSASVEFTNLGQYSDFQHLQIRMVARCDDAGSSNARDLRIVVNADTGANYSSHNLRGAGGQVYAHSYVSQTSIVGMTLYPRPSNPADQHGAAIIDILDFSSDEKYTTFRWLTGAMPDGENGIIFGSGLWLNQNPVVSLKIFPHGGNTASGSRISLYGLKARA